MHRLHPTPSAHGTILLGGDHIQKTVRFFMALFLMLPALIPPFSAVEEPESVTLPILMYHHISNDPNSCGDYTVSPETLEGDLAYLRDRGYRSISLRQLNDYAKGEGTLPEKPIMITFDDGQESFLSYALPLFEQYDMCAVLAIIGRCADAYTETEDHDIRYSYFSWPALGALRSSPHVELAVHTYDMHKLEPRAGCRIQAGEDPASYSASLDRDLSLIESRFESELGQIPFAFAYPYGYYCREARQLLSARGYSILFTCNQKVNQLHGVQEELLELGRFNRPNGMDRQRFFTQLGIETGL